MNEVIGLLLMFTAINYGGWVLFGYDFTLKEKIRNFILFEIFLVLLILGCFLFYYDIEILWTRRIAYE